MSDAAYQLMTALCRSDKPVCCDCGDKIHGQSETIAVGTLLTCGNENARPGRGRWCGRHSLVIKLGPFGASLVVGVSRNQFEELRKDRMSCTEALEYLGLLVMPVKKRMAS